MKQFKSTMILGWLMIAFAVVAANCFAENPTSKTLSPYFFVQGSDADIDAFPLKSTDVKVQVNGVIADVIVRQTYANSGGVPIHGRYIFPASTKAAVQGMSMTLGDRRIVAKIKEKEKAEKEFNQAKKSGKSASLLSQKRPNVFSMDVANIMPGDTVMIELHYTELLVPDRGVYEFVYPAVVGPRYSSQTLEEAPESDQWIKSPYLRKGDVPGSEFTITTHLSTGMDLHGVFSPSHTIAVRYDNPSLAHVTLDEREVDPGNRDYIVRYRLADKAIQSGLILYAGENENFFLLTVQPPEEISIRDIPPREYIFLVDVSGSMSGFPLDVSKQLLENLIGSLRPTDVFNVILFAGGSTQMSPISIPATQNNIEKALNVLSRQRGGGGTELYSAVKKALRIPRDDDFSRSVIVVTDGYIDSEKKVFDLIHNHLSTTNVFAFGVGSSVNRYMIEGMARAGQGEPFVVTKPEEAKNVSDRFCDYIKAPLLKDIRLDIQGFDAYDLEPQVIPDMFSERPIVVVGKWKGPAQGEIQVTGMTGQGDYQKVFDVSDTLPQEDNSPLRSLWARTKIARLSDFMFGRENGAYQEEITQLGLNYNLLTKYTSFIAVSEKVRNPGGEAKDVNQPLPLPKGVSEKAIGQTITQVPEPELFFMVALMVLVWLVSNRGMIRLLISPMR